MALYGQVGAGKTHFVKGLAGGLGIAENSVSSPTFSIVNVYDNATSVFHFDLYRLKNVRELEEIGFEEYLSSSAISIIEWPEIGERFLPGETIRISIDHVSETKRRFERA